MFRRDTFLNNSILIRNSIALASLVPGGGRITVPSTVIVTKTVTGTRRIALNAATKAGDVSCNAVTVNAKDKTRNCSNAHEYGCDETRTCSEEVWLVAASCAAVSKITCNSMHASSKGTLGAN